MTDQKGVAIVTGASSGIGFELCKLFARDGYSLLISARRADALNSLAEELQTSGATVTTFTTDLASSDAPQQICEAAEGMSQPVEVLVNNAGFGTYGPFATTDL